MLTQAQTARYQRDGYVVADLQLAASQLSDIRQRHAAFTQRFPEFSDYCPALLAYDRWFLDIAREPAIVSLVQSILGDDIALWNMSFFAKPAQVGSRTPWHQDGEYWPIEPLATCTVWIAIDDSTIENGCLRIIPGSHRSRVLAAHHQNDAEGLALNLELDQSAFDPATAVDIELQAGQMSLHDVFLFHGSEPNRSSLPRRGLTLRYMPTSSVYEHQRVTRSSRGGKLAMSRRTLYLMHGIDRSGLNDFDLRD